MLTGKFGRCRIPVGMLILRECGQGANQVCAKCNKPICDRHQVPTPQGAACPECAAALPEETVHPEATRIRRRNQYYTHHHYTPWHYYDDDYHAFDRPHGRRAAANPDDTTEEHDFTES